MLNYCFSSRMNRESGFFIGANMACDPRKTRAYKAMRSRKLKKARKNNEPCWICGGAIDYLAPAHTPDAWELDHVKPVDKYPELALDPTNCRSSHSSCNRSKSDSTEVLGLGNRRKRLM